MPTTTERVLSMHTDVDSDAILCLGWAATLHVYAIEFAGVIVVRGKQGSEGHTQSQPVLLRLHRDAAVKNLLARIGQAIEESRDDVPDEDDTRRWRSFPTAIFPLLDRTVESGQAFGDATAHDTAAVWLEVACSADATAIRVRIHANPRQLSLWQIDRMLDQLAHAVNHIGKYSTLSAAMEIAPEHTHLLHEWNRGDRLEKEACLHEMFLDHARKNPCAAAIAAWDLNLTYEQLEAESARVARHLQGLGVSKNSVVSLLFERSGWTVVAALGALRAGAAIMLLESSHPEERLQGMCNDVEAKVGICSVMLAPKMADLMSTFVTLPLPEKVGEEITTELPRTHSQDAAYIAFTSGSTGRPKGVLNEHGAMCTSMLGIGQMFGTNSDMRIIQGASYAFDAAVFEISFAWVHGACVCVPSERAKQQDLLAAMDEFQVSTAFVTPSVLRLMNPAQRPASLKTILLGGEQVGLRDLQAWCDRVHLGEAYGPAECAAISICRPNLRCDDDPLILGSPRWCRCWVVDAENPSIIVPVGAIGELVLEGRIVGRGYIKQPELNERLFPSTAPAWRNNFSPCAGRMYHTGDLARWDEGGMIKIAGRKDSQIKLHGQRIELGEIEETISRDLLPGQDVTIILLGGENGTPKRIAALLYAAEWSGDAMSDILRPDADHAVLPVAFEEARDRVYANASKQLPRAMIPTLWIPLTQPVPLSPTGKKDRRSLIQLTKDLPAALSRKFMIHAAQDGRASVAMNCYAEQLKAFVALILGCSPDEINLNHNLLALGGDSLTAMQICSLARKSGLEVHPIDILQAASLAEIPITLSSTQTRKDALSVPDLDLRSDDFLHHPFGGVKRILPATPMQDLFLDLPHEYFKYNLRGFVHCGRLAQAWSGLVQRHGMLRTVLDREKRTGLLHQIVLEKLDVALQSHLCNTKNDVMSKADELLCQEIAKGSPGPRLAVPGVQAHLFTSQDGLDHVLLLKMSHTHYDGLSMKVIWDDLKALYEDTPLPTLVPSFAEYADYCNSQDTDGAFQFWQDTLAGSSMTVVGGKPLPKAPGTVVRSQRVTISRPAAIGFTIASVVKAAWALTLSNHAQENDVVFGQVVNGRSGLLAGAEHVVGPCMNTIPVRVRLDSNATVQQLLSSVQSQHLQSLRYETLNLADICIKSTDWQHDMVWGSLVLHQNMLPDAAVSLDQASGARTEIYSEEETNEFILYSVPLPHGDLELQLVTCQEVLDQTLADQLTEATASWIGILCDASNLSKSLQQLSTAVTPSLS